MAMIEIFGSVQNRHADLLFTSDSKNKYSEDDIIKMLEFLIDNIFVVFAGKVFPADSRYSNGYKLCPSSRRHLPVFMQSGIHILKSFPDSRWKLGQRWALSCNFRWVNVGWRCKTISTLLIQKTWAQHVVQTLAQHVV